MCWHSPIGATGYRVRWGTVSGSYPNSSEVLPADARQWSITGLVTEQTCYVVMQAEYNGLWGPPSEEDSAIPHEGAIPWDSGDASAILQAVRNIIGGVPHGELFVLSPARTITWRMLMVVPVLRFLRVTTMRKTGCSTIPTAPWCQ